MNKKYFFAFFVLTCISYFFFRLTFFSEEGYLYIGHKLWSDFSVHVSLIRSFSMGNNFPPEYPLFAGDRIAYHYIFYAVVGLLERLGLPLAFSLNLLTALGFSGLLLAIYFLGKHFFSARAGVLAIFLFIWNGSLSFIQFLKRHPVDRYFLDALLENTQYSSMGPWDGSIVSGFWNLNIYTNQRHLGLGLAVLFFLIFLFETKKMTTWLSSWKNAVGLSVLVLILPLLHQASFFAFGIYMIIWCISQKFRLPKYVWGWLIGVGAGSVLVYSTVRSDFTPFFRWGFLAQETSLWGVAKYWWYNLGFYFLFIPVLFFKAGSHFRRLFFTGLTLFVLANMIQFSPDMINNHKLVNIFSLILVLAMAGVITTTWELASVVRKIGMIVLVFFITFSGVIDFFPVINDRHQKVPEYYQTDFGRWVAEHTSPNSVFVTNSYLYNPASLVGRKLFVGYGYFAWSMGYPQEKREKEAARLLSSDISLSDWCESAGQLNIEYVALQQSANNSDSPLDIQHMSLSRFATPLQFDSGFLVYERQSVCGEPR